MHEIIIKIIRSDLPFYIKQTFCHFLEREMINNPEQQKYIEEKIKKQARKGASDLLEKYVIKEIK